MINPEDRWKSLHFSGHVAHLELKIRVRCDALTGQSWPSPALAAGWETKAGREEGSDPRQAAGGGGAGRGGGGTQGLGPLHPSQTLPGCSRGSPLNPLPGQLAVQWLLLSQVLCLMPNHVLHPQLIVQQASVDLPSSSPPSWLGTPDSLPATPKSPPTRRVLFFLTILAGFSAE